MATATAIQDFSATLVHLLRVGLTPAPVADPNRITLATPDDFASFADPAQPAVTVFLYRIAVDGTMRNLPRRLLSDGSSTRPLLPVDMGFLITAWARQTGDEHLLMGRIMQVLYDRAEIGAADLQGTAWEAGDSVQLMLDSLPLEDHMRLWDSVDMPYRLSLTYLARVVGIEPGERLTQAPVVDASFRFGRVTPVGA